MGRGARKARSPCARSAARPRTSRDPDPSPPAADRAGVDPTMSSFRTFTLFGSEWVIPPPAYWLPWDARSLEAFLFAFAIAYATNIILGRRANRQIAELWASQVRRKGGGGDAEPSSGPRRAAFLLSLPLPPFAPSAAQLFSFSSFASVCRLHRADPPLPRHPFPFPQLSGSDNVLSSDFAQVGPLDPKDALDSETGLIQISGNEFVIPASGRRGVKRFEAAIYLRKRQDALYTIASVIFDGGDEIEFRVPLRTDAANPSTFSIGLKRMVKALLTTEEDVKAYAKAAPTFEFAKLPRYASAVGAPDLEAAAESSPYAFETLKRAANAVAASLSDDGWRGLVAHYGPALGVEAKLEGAAAASADADAGADADAEPRLALSSSDKLTLVWATMRSRLRYLHVTDSFPRGDDRGMAMVVFRLTTPPAPGELEVGARFAIALGEAHAVEAHMPAETRNKALSLRARVKVSRSDAASLAKDADDANPEETIRERLARKKADAEKERLAKLTPAARAKELERKEKLERKRAMKKYAKRA